MIRVGIDRQTFTIQKQGGISRYFSDLYVGLQNATDVKAELLFSRHQNNYLLERGIGKKLKPFQAKAYSKAMSMMNWGIQLSDHVDIQHSTYYLGKPNKGKNRTILVSTLYDMIPELMPSYFRSRPHANKLEWLSHSDLIISISDSATSDLVYFYPELCGRIKRIHLYSGFDQKSPLTKPASIPDCFNPYLLFIGQRGGYKNASFLLRAFASSKPAIHGYKLFFAGGGSLTLQEKALIDRLNLSNYVDQAGVSDPELWYLYQNASAVLVPSLAEGFSLPLVEALAADKPVICSDIPVHREVAKDYAQLVNPLQHDDWTETIRIIESISSPSQMLGTVGFSKKLDYFSRERMVNDHERAYKELFNQGDSGKPRISAGEWGA